MEVEKRGEYVDNEFEYKLNDYKQKIIQLKSVSLPLICIGEQVQLNQLYSATMSKASIDAPPQGQFLVTSGIVETSST